MKLFRHFIFKLLDIVSFISKTFINLIYLYINKKYYLDNSISFILIKFIEIYDSNFDSAFYKKVL